MNSKGTEYENTATELLLSEGYTIKARNWACARLGEIDIVAEKDGITVFVEVRARSNTSFGTPSESINSAKIAKIIRTAMAYIKRFSPETDFRFDVISVVPGFPPEHIKEAFTADGFGF
ncbi:MAG: YraN family protein [Elusimicrobiales bacterium]|jgi:putative endonuclease|nr:YraN family protein [Elusimicrobiales bacterium]